MDKNNWIDISMGDIESSAVLYENGNYPQALFYLQQSVEKCVKYIAISMMDFPESRLKKIGHESAKMFQEMAKMMYDTKDGFDYEWLNHFLKFTLNSATIFPVMYVVPSYSENMSLMEVSYE